MTWNADGPRRKHGRTTRKLAGSKARKIAEERERVEEMMARLREAPAEPDEVSDDEEPGS